MLWENLMKKEKGSYTVEAAFIVPIILGIVFMILYLIMWHHDRCVLQADAQNQIFLNAQQDKKEESSKDHLQKKLWIMTVDKQEVSSNSFFIKSSRRAGTDLKIPLLTFMLNGNQKIELQETYPVQQPDEVIRYRKKEEQKSDE